MRIKKLVSFKHNSHLITVCLVPCGILFLQHGKPVIVLTPNERTKTLYHNINVSFIDNDNWLDSERQIAVVRKQKFLNGSIFYTIKKRGKIIRALEELSK
jgi:hypothetical protein